MLILEQYGVRLVRIQEKDIELIRYWRNQSDIANHMEYRAHITEDAQKKWFQTVNNKYNYYFIIEFENKQVGLINVKNYDPSLGFGEGGIFIWDKEYIHSFAAVFASLCLLNFMLVKLNICKVSRIRILRDNERAIHYNKMLGYKLLPDQEEVQNQLYELHIDDYLTCGVKLNKAAAILSEKGSELKYSGNVCDENIKEINDLLI
jgi:UDP-4-amino-4,6-dideoxy-N-acetyl-beta-L-altrosamine N-acetyltransferase